VFVSVEKPLLLSALGASHAYATHAIAWTPLSLQEEYCLKADFPLVYL
jgi:hypothetical protein